jgi:hypothetical protein
MEPSSKYDDGPAVMWKERVKLEGWERNEREGISSLPEGDR